VQTEYFLTRREKDGKRAYLGDESRGCPGGGIEGKGATTATTSKTNQLRREGECIDN